MRNKNDQQDKLGFLKTGIKDYRVGALTRSSNYTVQKITKSIDPDWKFIVEYGAGDGVVTQELLKKMPEDGRLIAIELNEKFTHDLYAIREKDHRLTVIHGNVRKILKDLMNLETPEVDAVISGIPLTFFPPSDREELIIDTHSILRPEGKFVVYQFSPLIKPLLRGYFSSVKTSFELRNFPPYFIMEAEK